MSAVVGNFKKFKSDNEFDALKFKELVIMCREKWINTYLRKSQLLINILKAGRGNHPPVTSCQEKERTY